MPRLSLNSRRFSKYNFLIPAAILLLCSEQVAFAITDLERHEIATLNAWRAKARTTQLGSRLLDFFDNANRAAGYNPKDVQAHYRRAYVYGIIGCTESAITEFTSTLAINPNYAAAYTERGICYIDKKDYTRALSDLNKAVQLNPRSGDALFARGRVLLLTGRAQLALSDFRRCQSGDVTFVPALPGEYPANYYNAPAYYIGACYEAMDKTNDALRSYRDSQKPPRSAFVGYLHRYAEQPLDTSWKISSLEQMN